MRKSLLSFFLVIFLSPAIIVGQKISEIAKQADSKFLSGNYEEALSHYLTLLKGEHYDNNALYLLGRAYHYAYRFDDAIRAYNRFKDVGKGTAHNMKDVEKQIQYCFNAKELIKFPVDVNFQNLGKNVNSPYPDYYPFVTADETFMIYNSFTSQFCYISAISIFLFPFFTIRIKPPITNFMCFFCWHISRYYFFLMFTIQHILNFL